MRFPHGRMLCSIEFKFIKSLINFNRTGMAAVPAWPQLLMPPLVMKWQSVKDDDRALFPLLSCLTSVAQAMGPARGPAAHPPSSNPHLPSPLNCPLV